MLQKETSGTLLFYIQAMGLSEQRAIAKETLPGAPLLERNTLTSALSRWEVVLAYNLEEPLRFRQDYWWLEVLAESPLAARWVAWEWVRGQKETRFECTDWVRPASTHLQKTRIEGEVAPLPIHWHVPLPEDWPLNLPVRHPASGRRLGFVSPGDLPNLAPTPEGEFYLLRHLPASGAPAVSLVPKVWSIHRLALSLDKQEDDRTSDELP